MELSIVHNIDLVKALNELKSFNTYTACVRNNILRIIESCFFRRIPGKTGSIASFPVYKCRIVYRIYSESVCETLAC